jgi:CheY-like chemotaxis protein
MNVQQQGMSGLQLQSHLASSSRHIPIIFITASPGKESQALARELGAVNLLHNPVGDKALLKQIYLILKPEGIN